MRFKSDIQFAIIALAEMALREILLNYIPTEHL